MTDRIASIRERIAASRAASEGATPGPWYQATPTATEDAHEIGEANGRICTVDDYEGWEADAKHIAAHSPEHIATLLADLEAALAVVEAAQDVRLCGAGTQSMARLDATLSTFDTP